MSDKFPPADGWRLVVTEKPASPPWQKSAKTLFTQGTRNQGQFTGRSIYFLDPDGNTLEINEGGKKFSVTKAKRRQ